MACDPNTAAVPSRCVNELGPEGYLAAYQGPRPYPLFDWSAWLGTSDLAGFQKAYDEYNARILPLAVGAGVTPELQRLLQTVPPDQLPLHPEWREWDGIQGYIMADSAISQRNLSAIMSGAGVNPYEPYDERYAQFELAHGRTPVIPNTSVAPISAKPSAVDSIVHGFSEVPGVTVGGVSLSPWLLIGAGVVAYFLFFKDKGGR